MWLKTAEMKGLFSVYVGSTNKVPTTYILSYSVTRESVRRTEKYTKLQEVIYN